MEEKIPTDLIIRYLSNEATTDEAEALLTWVSADSKNQKIFKEWTDSWEHRLPLESSFDLSKGLQKLNTRINEYESQQIVHRQIFPWTKVAASIAIVISAMAAIVVANRFIFATDPIEMTEYKTPADKMATIILADGSKITLNQNTSIEYPLTFATDKREIILTGEAFFEIEKDSLRPFRIHTGEITTQVLGTSFNIHARSANVTVSVATGKVQVSHNKDVVALLPNEKVEYKDRQKELVKGSANLEMVLAWKNPSLVFKDTRLSDVMVRLEKRFGVSIQFEKESLRGCLITGKFSNQSLDQMLTAITFSSGIHFRKIDNQITLYGKGCEE